MRGDSREMGMSSGLSLLLSTAGSYLSLVNHHVLRSPVLPGRLLSHRPPRTDTTVLAESATAIPAVATAAPTTPVEQCWPHAPLPVQPIPSRTDGSCPPRLCTRLLLPVATCADITACPVPAVVAVPHHHQPNQCGCWSLITAVHHPCHTRATHPRATTDYCG